MDRSDTQPTASADSYLSSSGTATPGLHDLLIQKIRSEGPLSFSEYMAAALYDPKFGYYTRNHAPKTGRAGDFFTSVSIGPLFGRLLAERLSELWKEYGSPSRFHVLDLGAHDAQLLVDLVAGASAIDPAFSKALEAHAVELSHSLRETHPAAVTSYAKPDDLPHFDEPAVCLSNELFDAFPCDCFIHSDDGWMERKVGDENGSFTWTTAPISEPTHKAFVSSLGNDFPTGTVAEHRIGISKYLHVLDRKISTGSFITIDYGFERESLYCKERTDGTLQCYRDHQVVSSPFDHPGSADITTHIDFTELIEIHQALGHETRDLELQSTYLTRLARPLLLSMEKSGNIDLSTIRQFQSLSHPGIMGRSFQVLEAKKS